jgi:hypothetical protein
LLILTSASLTGFQVITPPPPWGGLSADSWQGPKTNILLVVRSLAYFDQDYDCHAVNASSQNVINYSHSSSN